MGTESCRECTVSRRRVKNGSGRWIHAVEVYSESNVYRVQSKKIRDLDQSLYPEPISLEFKVSKFRSPVEDKVQGEGGVGREEDPRITRRNQVM